MEFQVLKTINNNVVSCVDADGREHIVMGRGLGFGLKVGQMVSEEQAEKIFRIADRTKLERLKDLFSSLPQDQVEFCTELIQYACTALDRKLNESIYYTLSDHISFAIYRVKKGMEFTNALQTEVRLFYPKEYAVGCYALAEIERRFQVTLPEDEAASIALHLVNAEYETSFGITMQVTQALGQMLQVLKTHPEFQLDRTSLYFDELIIHLKFLALSMFSLGAEQTQESEFARMIGQMFPKEEHLAGILTADLERASGHRLSPEQRAYLIMNLHRVKEK